MSFENLIRQIRLGSEIQENSFIGEIVKTRLDKDRYGRDVLKLWIRMEGTEDVYVLSLPPSLLREFAKTALDYGFKTVDEIINTKWLFKRVNPEAVAGEKFKGYDRFVPVSFVCTRQWLEARYANAKELSETEVAELRRKCAGEELYEWLRDNFIAQKTRGTVVYVRK